MTGGFCEQTSVTSGAARTESMFPWGRDGVLTTAYILHLFLTKVLLDPLPKSRVSCGLILRQMHCDPNDVFQRGKRPTCVRFLSSRSHMYTLSSSFGSSWGIPPPKSPLQAEFVC